MVSLEFWKKIRYKTLVIIALTIIGMTVVIHGISAEINLESFSSLERQEMAAEIDTIQKTLEKDQEALTAANMDWGCWNDTYEFAADQDPTYIDDNLGGSSLDNLNIGMFILLNYSGSLLFGTAYDTSNETWSDLPSDVSEHLHPDGYLMVRAKAMEYSVGILNLKECPILICSGPILTNYAEGPVHGMIIMGKWLDDEMEASLAEALIHDVVLHGVDDASLTSSIGPAEMMALNLTGEAIVPLSDDEISGFCVPSDVYGNPAVVVETRSPRDIFTVGQAGQSYLLIAFAVSGLIFGIVTTVLLETIVVSRISRLGKEVSDIATMGSTDRRVASSGNDEIGDLGGHINGMLAALDQSQRELIEAERANRDELERLVKERTNELLESNKALTAEVEERQFTEEELRESESRYRAVVEDQMELIRRARPDGTITFVNQTYAGYYATTAASLINTKFQPSMSEADQHLVEEHLGRLCFSEPVVSYQHRVLMPDGSGSWQHWTSRGIFDESGKLVEVQSVGRDITERVKLEQELLKTQ